jgi:hypothetical protein
MGFGEGWTCQRRWCDLPPPWVAGRPAPRPSAVGKKVGNIEMGAQMYHDTHLVLSLMVETASVLQRLTGKGCGVGQ